MNLPLCGIFLCKRMMSHLHPDNSQIYSLLAMVFLRIRTICGVVLTYKDNEIIKKLIF